MLGVAAFALAGCGPPVHAGSSAIERDVQALDDPAAIERDATAFVEALKPRGSGRPRVVVLARNEGTETTDFLLTHAVLQRSGVADVLAVTPLRGRVRLYPVFEVNVAQDFAGFDAAHPRVPIT
jgi:hypothetical protein